MIPAHTIEQAVPAGRGGCGCGQNPTPAPVDSVTCAVCGLESSFPLPADPPGPADKIDLEGRPIGARRMDYATLIQRCPGCGYCAREIDLIPRGFKEFVLADGFQEKLHDPTMPALASSFLCDTAVRAASLEAAEASLGISLLHAAWACDDAGRPLAARRCRNWAANQLIEALQLADDMGERQAPDLLLLTELLRRARRFPEAQSFLSRARTEKMDDYRFRRIVLLKSLITRKDAQHTSTHKPKNK